MASPRTITLTPTQVIRAVEFYLSAFADPEQFDAGSDRVERMEMRPDWNNGHFTSCKVFVGSHCASESK